MSEDPHSEQGGSKESTSTIVGMVLLFAVLFAPAAIIFQMSLYYSYAQIISPMWTMFSEGGPGGTGLRLETLEYFLATLPFTFLRYVFVYMMVKFYRGRTTRKRIILVGISSELQLLVLSFPALLMILFSSTDYLMIFLPIPSILVIGLLFIHFIPPNPTLIWIEKEELHQWWLDSEANRPEESKFSRIHCPSYFIQGGCI